MTEPASITLKVSRKASARLKGYAGKDGNTRVIVCGNQEQLQGPGIWVEVLRGRAIDAPLPLRLGKVVGWAPSEPVNTPTVATVQAGKEKPK